MTLRPVRLLLVGLVVALAMGLVGQGRASAALNWDTFANLSVPGQNASSPDVRISADGTRATAIWVRYVGPNSIIQTRSASRIGNGYTWGPLTNLSAPGEDAASPAIELSADGSRATAVWERFDGANEIVQSSSATIVGNVATWGAVTDLSAPGGNAMAARVALAADGSRATAVWQRHDGSDYIIQSRSATIAANVATWGAPTDLSAPGENGWFPDIALSADGSLATSVWYRPIGLKYIVQSSSATILGNVATWSAVSNLSAPGRDAVSPRVCVSADGLRATAVWYRDDGAHNIVQSSSATILGNVATWGAVSDLSAPGQHAEGTQLSASADGATVTAVWRRSNGANEIVQSSSATVQGNVATWGAVTDLSALGQNGFNPMVRVTPDGSAAVAVWGAVNLIRLSRATIAGNVATWGAETIISDPSVAQSTFPRIALSSDGSLAVAVWRAWQGTSYVIQSSPATEEEASIPERALRRGSATAPQRA